MPQPKHLVDRMDFWIEIIQFHDTIDKAECQPWTIYLMKSTVGVDNSWQQRRSQRRRQLHSSLQLESTDGHQIVHALSLHTNIKNLNHLAFSFFKEINSLQADLARLPNTFLNGKDQISMLLNPDLYFQSITLRWRGLHTHAAHDHQQKPLSPLLINFLQEWRYDCHEVECFLLQDQRDSHLVGEPSLGSL